ncbi:DUF6443 domain-containing protein [Epilithonimonas zeae]|uniref:DUF6443 domain-containing protein n=1 Tax=Epilithonimonas zeae TaxID=1416779 RepID=UPI00200F73A9|nr:DUF6443 domain-containing protein [Epilithonimonas zeae]UQB69787.1 RHS repeat-associated core domain-containing protein [Epilithonimonas zeae]
MKTKILSLLGMIWSISGFSQLDPLTDSYQPPQTYIAQEIRMLPGFHADSKNVVYNNGGEFIARSKAYDPSNPNPVITNPPVVYNPSLGENYIYTRTYLAPVTQSNNYAPQIQGITYFDGLGRPKQNIAIKSTPSGKDLVTPIVYDGFGRPYLDVLPIPLSSKSSEIHPGIDQNSGSSFYGSYAYSEKKLENSPLDRVLEQYGPGEDWRTYSKRNLFDYGTNNGNEVLKFVTNTSWSTGANISILSLATGNYYTQATLYKNKITDEDDNISYEFKNGQGQTLLIRKMLTATESADTYYIYNEYDQLAFVISPKASDKVKTQLAGANLGETGELLAELSYQYRYDGRNRLVEKKLPGKGWEYMVYDKQDRLVATQDAELGKDKKWLVTKYDQFGRVAYTGMFVSTQAYGSSGRDYEQGQANGKDSNNVTRDDSLNTTVNSIKLYYTQTGTYPDTISELLSINYYDTYPPYSDLPVTGDYDVYGQKFLTQTYAPSESNPNTQISTKSLPTASMVKATVGNLWTKNYTYYDQKARPIYTHNINHLGGYTKTGSLLDFSGAILKTYTNHKRSSTGTLAEVRVNERFVYDHQNRMKQHYHQVDNGQEVLLTENIYDELGRVDIKKVGNNLQELKYAYNIRGWMTGINDIASPGDKLFAYKIRYNEPLAGLATPNVLNYPNLQVERKYNCNIAEIDWYVKDEVTTANPYRFGYVYDKLNRLKAGFYQNPTNRSFGDNSEMIEEYDLNGNIVKLKRFGTRYKGLSIPLKIDDLTYVYTGTGNKVTSISDTGSISGYEGGGGAITYDLNGNMKAMPDKSISNIEYNYLNLPTKIVQPNPTTYLYRADGVKLSKTFTVNNNLGSTTVKTEYFDSFQYTSGIGIAGKEVLESDDPVTLNSMRASNIETFRQLDDEASLAAPGDPENQIGAMSLNFFPTAEGFYNYKNSKYIYQYKDHLGNVRLSYSRNPATNEAQVLDRNDYYPFGMNFQNIGNSDAGNIFDARGTPFNYKFQEQELQETGFYAFKWRNYMPDVGRFFNVDPLAEKYTYNSTYAFSENAVISYRELEGLEKVLAIFYTGGAQGAAKVYPKASEAGTTGQLFNYAASNAREKGYGFKGAIIGSGFTNGSSVSKGTKFIENNYEKGDIVITYGYSYGGDNSMELGSELKDKNIPVQLSMIVDSSDGPLGNSTVKTDVSDNTLVAVNTYQTTPDPNSTASGGPIKAENSKKTGVVNVNSTSKDTTHQNIDEKALNANKQMIDLSIPKIK